MDYFAEDSSDDVGPLPQSGPFSFRFVIPTVVPANRAGANGGRNGPGITRFAPGPYSPLTAEVDVTAAPAGWNNFVGGVYVHSSKGQGATSASTTGTLLARSDGYDFEALSSFTYGRPGTPSIGGLPGAKLAAPIVGLAPSADADGLTEGYWMVGADGGVFTLGDAHFYGSAASYHPASPIVGIAATADGGGYWMVGADGGVFSFGDAHFYGSAAPYHPGTPIIGITSTGASGYYLASKAGGIFAFGNAPWHGSAIGKDPYPAAPSS